MKPICIAYHGLFFLGDPPKFLPNAFGIVFRQMEQLRKTGLLKSAKEMFVGINGGIESKQYVDRCIPEKAKVTYHGLKSRSENLTICQLHEWSKTHPGWNVLYFHAKGSSSEPGSPKAEIATEWRNTMMADLVTRWQGCVGFLDAGYDIVCSHWRWNAADGTQHIPAGNHIWVKSDFVAKLPSMHERARIKEDGIGALTSRYESEVFWGNGPRPNVKQFRENAGSGIPLAPQFIPATLTP